MSAEPLGTLGELAHVRTKHCAACGAVFVPVGSGHRRLTCDVCRTAPQCKTCYGYGGLHAPSCSKLRACKGCGQAGVEFVNNASYCATCKERQCPECRVYGGQHGRNCKYERRTRRTNWLREYRGVVTEQDIVDLYLAVRPHAVAVARRICGELFAEDVVHDAAVYLLAQRDYLRFPPNEAYFLRAVKHGALRVLQAAWHRHVVAMDPVEIVMAEQAMYAQHVNGHASNGKVRLPVEA